MKNHFDLSDRVAVVLGGTSGLGQEIARGLAGYGATVVPAGRRSEQWAVNVEERRSVEILRQNVVETFGQVDILINAAGVTKRTPLIEVTDAEWQSLFDVNLRGALIGSQVFYPDLKAKGRGRIVNIVSLSSYVAFHEVAAYSASKSGLLSLTRSMGCEWARDGICVNAIAPGVFPTELNSVLLTGTRRGEEILMRTPMGRFGRPEELIGAAVFLSSEAASFMTGQCITVDGGYLASGVNS